MWKLVIGALVIGIALTVMGVRELKLKSAAKAEPQELTCAQLAASGPGENAYVRMTDFILYEDAAVLVSKKRSKSIKHAWVPAVASDGAWAGQVRALFSSGSVPKGPLPKPHESIVLIKVTDQRSESALASFFDAEVITGMVINEIDSIDSKESRMIQDELPGVNLSKAWMVEANRAPAGAEKIAGFFGAGFAVLAAPFAMMVIRARKAARDLRPTDVQAVMSESTFTP